MSKAGVKLNLKSTSMALIALSVIAGAFSAEAASPNLAARSNALPKPPVQRWSLPLNLEASSTLHASGAYEREAMTSLSFAPSYQWTKNLKLSGAAMIYKEDTGAGNSGLDNTLVTASWTQPLKPTITGFGTAGGILPTNQTLRDETSYQGGARLGAGVNFGSLVLDSSLRYILNYTRNFHQLSQSADEAFNVRETFVQTLEYNLPFNDQWSLQTAFSYTYGLTYLNDMRTKFYTGVDINWSVMKNFIVSAGTSNQGNALKPNGSDTNISFYDDNSSVVKLGITYIL